MTFPTSKFVFIFMSCVTYVLNEEQKLDHGTETYYLEIQLLHHVSFI